MHVYRLALWIVCGVAIQILLATPADASDSVIYQSVYSTNRWGTADILKVYDVVDDAPLFIIRQQRLYLKTQSTRPKWNLYMEVDHPVWDVQAIARLKTEHPEVVPLLPDPEAANGGIQWIPLPVPPK